jgi:hypothetical protein
MINVINIIEREDGGADLTLEMTRDDEEKLIEYAIINMLKEAIKEKDE